MKFHTIYTQNVHKCFPSCSSHERMCIPYSKGNSAQYQKLLTLISYDRASTKSRYIFLALFHSECIMPFFFQDFDTGWVGFLVCHFEIILYFLCHDLQRSFPFSQTSPTYFCSSPPFLLKKNHLWAGAEFSVRARCEGTWAAAIQNKLWPWQAGHTQFCWEGVFRHGRKSSVDRFAYLQMLKSC